MSTNGRPARPDSRSARTDDGCRSAPCCYHATGLSDIVAESGAPRGSLYFYFPGGKDELARAALEAAGADWRMRVGAAIADAKDVGAVISAVIEMLASDLEASGFEHGCPVAAVALEATSESVRKTIALHYASLEATVVERLAAAGFAPAPAKQLATVAVASIEGALLLARVQRSRAPLVTIGNTLRAMVAAMSMPAARPKRAARTHR